MSEVGWIDTHNHLQVDIFDEDVEALWERAKSLGVTDAVITAGSAADWDRVVSRAQKLQIHYTLGIHPLYVDRSKDEDLDLLWERLNRALGDPLFVGIGEIGLEENPQIRDEAFFARQLDFAAKLALPVSVHVRKTASRVLKYLRRICGGTKASRASSTPSTAPTSSARPSSRSVFDWGSEARRPMREADAFADISPRCRTGPGCSKRMRPTCRPPPGGIAANCAQNPRIWSNTAGLPRRFGASVLRRPHGRAPTMHELLFRG